MTAENDSFVAAFHFENNLFTASARIHKSQVSCALQMQTAEVALQGAGEFGAHELEIVAKGSHPTPFELLQGFPSTALRQRDHSAGEKRCPKTHAMHCDVFGHVQPFM